MLHILTATLLTLAAEAGATIQGVVRTEGAREPIPMATITIRALRRTVQADAHGFFVLSGVPAGQWQVEANALGYAANSVRVATGENGTVRLDFELTLRPVQLPGVLVQTDEQRVAEFVAPPDPGPAAVRMHAQRLKTMPGLAEPDIFRALQMQPSVTAISDYSTALYVRGGSADQNLIQLDGMPLFNPYHVGGIFSAVPADAVSTVDLWPGALPARVGDRLSSAVVINTREGSKDHVRTSGGIGLVSANVTVDGPFDGTRGSFVVSGRRTYIDAITDAVYGLGLVDFTMPYGFTDLYLKATHRVGELGSISLAGYWDGEGLWTPERMRGPTDDFGEFKWGSRMTSLSFRQPLSGSLLLQARGGYTDFRGRFDAWGVDINRGVTCGENGCDMSQADLDTTRLVLGHTTSRDVVTGADLTWFRRRHTLRGGVQLDQYLFDHSLTAYQDVDDDYFPLFGERSSLATVAGYIEDEWQPTDRLSMRAGVRVLTAGRLGTEFMPRVGARWQMTPSLALTAGAGRYAQVLRSLKDDESVVASLIAYDVLSMQPDDAGLARGSDAIIGGEYVDAKTRVRMEAFTRTMSGLVLAPEPDEPLQTPPLIVNEHRVGTGSARGIELSARRLVGRFDLGLAYALSEAQRNASDHSFAPRFDRRHQLDMSGDYRWGENALLSARLVLATGQPFTPPINVTQPMVYDPIRQQWQEVRNTIVLGGHNSGRLPSYTRLDVAARRSYGRRWFGREGTLTPYVQVVNVLNHRNALIAEPQPYGQPRLSYWPQLPFLPTLGVEWRF